MHLNRKQKLDPLTLKSNKGPKMNKSFTLMKITTLLLTIFLCSLSVSLTAHAHSRYVLPSHTVLSGEGVASVTLSSSISNDIFHHDMPFGDDGSAQNISIPLKQMFQSLNTTVTHPNGQTSEMNWHAYARQSIADLNINASGTYQVSIKQPKLLITSFKKENGQPGRVFGTTPIPQNVTDIIKREINASALCYISFNKPNKTALMPKGKGLELAGDSHPNDLFVNEGNSFRLLMNGKGVKNSALSFTKSGSKHRNQRKKITKTTDENGYFNITFSEPGFYLLEAEQNIDAIAGAPVDSYHHSLYITLEVFPE